MQAEGAVTSLLQHRDETQILTGNISAAALEQIRGIIEREHASCTITSPMDKLEEFFIRTVTSAQEQDLPTSGAVSSTGISGFLAEESGEPGILEKLVETTVDEPPATGDAEVSKVTEPVETVIEPRADNELLEKLTRATTEQVSMDAVEKTAPRKFEETAAPQVKRDVLEELTGRAETDRGLTEPVDADKTGEDEDA